MEQNINEKKACHFMKTLQKPFLKIRSRDGESFGGNQAWFPYKFLRKSGCGVISAVDVLLHIEEREQLTEKKYIEYAKNIWLHYLPVIPGFGMNGLTLMLGMNCYFRKQKLPYKAFWGVSGRKMLSRIDRMLSEDIPVILSAGPNFPNIFGKHKLSFYTKINDKKYIPATKTKAHFVTVTGRDGIYLQVSSWGKEYYIDIREYREYVKHCSSPLVSNIICITKKKTIQ